jgi:hypothetical protein
MNIGKDAALFAEPVGTQPPLVSIVTPSFQQGRFLRRTIDSVLRQTYPHIDYLVIDGGSTDESTAILRSYGNRFFWVSEPDRGQTDAINKGFARSHGQIRAYLNSDDVLVPDAVACAVQEFCRHPGCCLVYGKALNIGATDEVLGFFPTEPFRLERLLEECFICQPATFWRAALAERIGSFDATLHFAMDYDYWLRAAHAGERFLYLPRVLGCNRQYPQAKTWAGRMHVLQEVIAVCRRHAGEACFSHYIAYWQHRLFEKTHGWPRWGRWLPGARWILALLHSRWHRNRGSWPLFAGDLLAGAGRRLGRMMSGIFQPQAWGEGIRGKEPDLHREIIPLREIPQNSTSLPRKKAG